MPPLLSASLDIIRLVAIPVFIWAAYRDIKTRRVSNRPWVFLAGLGAVLLLADALLVELGMPTHRYPPTFWRTIAISIFTVIPLAYIAWLFGLFGGADAKALMALAILFPLTPSYSFTVDAFGWGTVRLPEYTFPVTIFAFTIFANAILLSMLYPAVMTLRNVSNRDFSKAMFLARPLSLTALDTAHGVLFETHNGYGRGLDLDVLRAYLEWRESTLISLEPLQEPTQQPDSGGMESEQHELRNQWGVEEFFEETEKPTYGMTPETVRDALELLYSRVDENKRVWVSPGIPYMVPFAAGVCIAVTYGNLMIALLILLQ